MTTVADRAQTDAASRMNYGPSNLKQSTSLQRFLFTKLGTVTYLFVYHFQLFQYTMETRLKLAYAFNIFV